MVALDLVVASVLALVTPLASPQPAQAKAAPRRFQPMDVFQLQWANDPQISPDGSRIAYERRYMDVMKDLRRADLWLVDRVSGEHTPITTGQVDASSPRWSPDGKRLLYVSSGTSGAQMFVRWMDRGAVAQVTHLVESPGALSWSPDGKAIAFTMRVPAESEPLAKVPAKPEGAEWAEPSTVIRKLNYRQDGEGYLKDGYTQVFVVPADGGAPRQLTSGSFHHGGPLAWTPDGQFLIVSANRHDDWERHPVDDDLFEVRVADGVTRQITHRNGKDEQPAVSPDGEWIAYTGYDDRRQGYQVTRLSIVKRDGTQSRVVSANFDRDVNGLTWAGDGKSIFAQVDDHGITKVVAIGLDGKVRDVVSGIGGADFDRPYTSGSYSASKNGWITFTLGTPDRPADVAVVDDHGGNVRRLTDLNASFLAQRDMGPVTEITWASSHDQRSIEGWIVKPPGFDATKKYPLILEIHGGPFAAYGPHFAIDMQLYAAAGYVVLYTNPRGSTSYGEEFGNLIHHAYPSHDYEDLMSGVDAVIAQGYVDPARLYVTGGSGGGVLSAWIVGKTDRFKAAVVQKPVINWASFVLTSDGSNFFGEYWFAEQPWEKPENYLARSPLTFVGNVKTPTMLICGEADYRTPISESEQFYTALRLRGIDTLLVRVPGASHDIGARPSHAIEKALNILAWFAKYP